MSEQLKPPYIDEILQSDNTASELLMQMVIGALNEGQMPPRPVFEWGIHNVAYNMAHLEHFVLMDEQKDPEKEKALHQSVEMLSSMLGIASKNKLFGVVASTEQILKVRKMRYPAHMDLTYGGRLP